MLVQYSVSISFLQIVCLFNSTLIYITQIHILYCIVSYSAIELDILGFTCVLPGNTTSVHKEHIVIHNTYHYYGNVAASNSEYLDVMPLIYIFTEDKMIFYVSIHCHRVIVDVLMKV